MLYIRKEAFMSKEKKTYPTPRGDAANRAKQKYNRKSYDRMELILPKGKKDELKEFAKMNGWGQTPTFQNCKLCKIK